MTEQRDLPDSVYAFPRQRKEPLTDASHVRNAIGRFDQVIEALHMHMLDDSPRLFYLHWWAVGDPASVAAGLRAAPDHIHTR